MAKNTANRKSLNFIEKSHNTALFERVAKGVSEGAREIDREITGAILTEVDQFNRTIEPDDEAGAKAAKIALIQTAMSKAKAAVSRTVTRRNEAYQRAVALLPAVEQARCDINDAYIAKGMFYKEISDEAIGNWLTQREFLPPQGGKWTGAQVREVVFRAPERIIMHLVLECRTRMTAKALSADFSQRPDLLTELEREYLDKIATAIDISHRLHGHRPRGRDELLEEARHMANEVAKSQREAGSDNMLARERLWKQYAEYDGSVLLDQDSADWP